MLLGSSELLLCTHEMDTNTGSAPTDAGSSSTGDPRHHDRRMM
jgi:hypothetical protein